jgi:hypothetical protein
MPVASNHQRSTYGLIALVILIVAMLGTAAVVFVVRFRNAADYPGAVFMGEHNLYKFWPHPVIRRDTSYLTAAPFREVYHFYSVDFNLGPEQHALGPCISMANSTTAVWIIENDMAVTLCDTPSGRMIFVMRAVSLRRR